MYLNQFQCTANGRTGPGVAAQKPATAYKMARGQYLRLPKTEGATARGLLLTHAVAASMAAQVGE